MGASQLIGVSQKANYRRKLAIVAIGALVVATCTVAGGSQAIASTSDRALTDDQAVAQALAFREQSVVDLEPQRTSAPVSTESGAEVTLAEGLTVSTGEESELRMRPVSSDSYGSWTPGGLALFKNDAESDFVLSGPASGANAGYAVIHGPSAPSSFRFEFTVNNEPAQLELIANGGVKVLNKAAEVNLVLPAWALDAAGKSVGSSYSVQGNILTQEVDHKGATYPVVADPRLACDGIWCTLELTKAETAAMADNTLNASIACAFVGPFAVACAALILAGWAFANAARAYGKCVGIRVWQANMVTNAHLVMITCP